LDCPNCHEPLVTIGDDVRVSRCPRCEGTWYDKDDLRVLKDRESGGDYQWIDIDLWREIDKFKARRQQRYSCPRDGEPMTTVHYGDSSIAVDVCAKCEGMWLDKEEYGEILRHLERSVDTRDSGDYLKDLRDEVVEVLEGHENPLEAIKDVGKVLYLLELRFIVEHPALARISSSFPKF
jgi:Zn-finger nucleic acid-binding protein